MILSQIFINFLNQNINFFKRYIKLNFNIFEHHYYIIFGTNYIWWEPKKKCGLSFFEVVVLNMKNARDLLTSE